ncbi:MAG: hypothetical protein OQK81_03485 [Candidatus Bathyarchaeota archaeon]|nr:hypothetical protein [Candidatus Bathyarchaeota archaeon]
MQGGFGNSPTADSRLAVQSYLTGTLFEIRPDNMYQPLIPGRPMAATRIFTMRDPKRKRENLNTKRPGAGALIIIAK